MSSSPPSFPISEHKADACRVIIAALRHFAEPGQTIEIRIPKANLRTSDKQFARSLTGFWPWTPEFEVSIAKPALDVTNAGVEGVYFTLNPLDPACVQRAKHKLQPGRKGIAASDADVIRRRWLLIDIDPKRPTKTSATDEERARARETADKIIEHLTAAGWPAPIVGDSGNGVHLFYRIDEPTDDNGLIARCLVALANRFDVADQVEVDRKVFNPSRICKLYGTWSRKGQHSAERPHRLAQLLSVPDGGTAVVPTQLLAALAAEVPDPTIVTPPQATVGATAQQTTSVASVLTVPTAGLAGGPSHAEKVRRARAYLRTIDPAISGQNGHNHTFQTALKVVMGFDLSTDQALEAFHEWNKRCQPPWEEHELLHKIDDVQTKGTGPRGHLLNTEFDQIAAINADITLPACTGNGSNGIVSAAPAIPAAAVSAGAAAGTAAAPSVNGSAPHRTYMGLFRNFKSDDDEDGKPKQTGLPPQLIHATLTRITDGWPCRVGKSIFAPTDDHDVLWLDSHNSLFAWISKFLPGDTNRIEWGKGPQCISREHFYCYLQQCTPRFTAVERFPHHQPIPGHYYIHQPLAGGDGKAFYLMLARFCPASHVDLELLRAFFMSLFWGGGYGKRPAWLFRGEDGDQIGGRGIGKTHVALAGAQLVGGYISLSTHDTMESFKKRLLSEGGRQNRLILLDNVKTLKFSWDEMESLLTAPTISGHAMYVGESTIPNTFTVCITLNGASLSKDMAQRAIPVYLKRPEYKATWWDDLVTFIVENRWRIIGDILAEFKREPVTFATVSRWSRWDAEVLARIYEPVEVQRVIKERQESMDADAEESDMVKAAIVVELKRCDHCPETEIVFIPNKRLGQILQEALNEKKSPNRWSAYLNTLGIPELRRGRDCDGGRGWRWIGPQSDPVRPAIEIRENPNIPYDKKPRDFGV